MFLKISYWSFQESDMELLPHGDAECENVERDWLKQSRNGVEDWPQTPETGVNLLQLSVDSEHDHKEQVSV